jgi:hypothetical protein
VCEGVPNQKKNLENQQAGSPNGRSTSEYGQNQFAEEQLHKEEKKSADKDRDAEQKAKIRRRAGSVATLLAGVVMGECFYRGERHVSSLGDGRKLFTAFAAGCS